jgi:DNA-binding beta-propeller fold protein YncE
MYAFSRIKLLMLACFFLLAFNAAAWDRGKVERFATLPAGSPNPEGVTVDPRNGDVYVTGFMPTQPAGPGKVFVFDREGDLKRTLLVTGSSNALLGIDFHPDTHELLVVDFGGAKVLRVNPFSGAASVFTAPVGAAGLNALGFDKAGNVYISDSGRGTIWRTGSGGGAAEDWVTSPLLRTTGFPPFGANGLDFSRDGSFLFVANTGDDTILRVHTATTPRVVEVFTNSINGADGLFVDERDNLWVCANQSDEIVVVDKTGKAISKLGDFNGVRNGSPVGLLFPASLARHGEWIYITNLSLDTRTIGLPQSVDSQWAAKVKRHTISRIRARILGFERGGDD